jgi:peptidoglycan/xylan/chitin deacetylase (PgdA/CDA1 family)
MRVLRELSRSLDPAGVLVLCYHVVRRADHFAGHLAVLAERGYTILPLARFTAWLGGTARLATPAALLTFDHVYAEQLAHAVPALTARGLPATFFPVSAHVADDREHRRAVAALAMAGHSVGAHTHTHRPLTALPDADVRRELAESRQVLEDVVGARVGVFCYPFGAWDARVAALVAEAGFDAAFTADLGVVRAGDDRFRLRRACVLGDPAPREFAAFLSGRAPVPGALLLGWKLRERWLR